MYRLTLLIIHAKSMPLMILHKRSSLLPVEGPLVLQPPSVTSNALNLFTVEIGHYTSQFLLSSLRSTDGLRGEIEGACTYLGYQHLNC